MSRIDAGQIGVTAVFDDVKARQDAEAYAAFVREKLAETARTIPRHNPPDAPPSGSFTSPTGGPSPSPLSGTSSTDPFRGELSRYQQLLRERNDLLARQVASFRDQLTGVSPGVARAQAGFTKSDLERKILSAVGPLAGDRNMDYGAERVFNSIGGATTFHRELPGEVRKFLEGRAHLRKFFETTEDSRAAGGADAMSELGVDRYLEHVERIGGGRAGEVRRAIEIARESSDPDLQRLTRLYDDPEAAREAGQAVRTSQRPPRPPRSPKQSAPVFEPDDDDPLYDARFDPRIDELQREAEERRQKLKDWQTEADVKARRRTSQTEAAIETGPAAGDTSTTAAANAAIDSIFQDAKQRDKAAKGRPDMGWLDDFYNGPAAQERRARQAAAMARAPRNEDVFGIGPREFEGWRRNRQLGPDVEGPLPRATEAEMAYLRLYEARHPPETRPPVARPNVTPFGRSTYHDDEAIPGIRPPASSPPSPPPPTEPPGLPSEEDEPRGRGTRRRPQTIWNKPLVSSGVFFNAFFGAAELAKASAALRRSEVDSMLARSPIERLDAQVTGIRAASSGFFASIASEIWNPIANFTPFDSVEKLEKDAAIQKSRLEDLDFVSASQKERRDRGQMRDASRGGVYAARRQAAIAEARRATDADEKEAQQIASDLAGTYTETVTTGFDDGQGSPVTQQQITRYTISDAGKRASLAGRRRELQQSISEAGLQRDFELQQIEDERQDQLLGLRGTAAGLSGDAVSRQVVVQRQARELSAADERRQKAYAGNAEPFRAYTSLQEDQRAELGAIDSVAERERLRRERLVRASQLQRAGYSKQAAIEGVNAEFQPMYGPRGGSVQNFEGLDRTDPNFSKKFATRMKEYGVALTAINDLFKSQAIRDAGEIDASQLARQGYGFQAAQRAIEAERQVGVGQTKEGSDDRARVDRLAEERRESAFLDEQRRQIRQVGRIRSLGLSLAYKPMEAAIADNDAALNEANAGKSPFSPEYAGNVMEAALREQKIKQDFRDQSNRIFVQQSTANRQLDRLFARDPVGAESAGNLGETVDQSFQLFKGGFNRQATNALDIGIRQQNLLKQNYLDAFRGEEFDTRLFSTSNPADSQDPSQVLKQIADNIATLQNILAKGIQDGFNGIASDGGQ